MSKSGAVTTEARLRGPWAWPPLPPNSSPGPSEPPQLCVWVTHPQAPKFMRTLDLYKWVPWPVTRGGPVKPGRELPPSRSCRAQRDREPGALLLLLPWSALTSLVGTATACLSPWRAKGSTPTLGRLNSLRHISFFKHLKVKVIVAQPCLTFHKSMGCSPPGSSVHGILQARILEWVCHSFLLGVFPTQGLNLGLLHCSQIPHPLSHQGSTKH